jgi:hypothetical protein
VRQIPLINVPILVETDSRMGYRSLVHFNYDEAAASASAKTTRTSARVQDALNIRGNTAGYIAIVDAQPLFNCDDDPRTSVSRKVTTVSRQVAADRVVTAEVVDMLLSLQGQDVPTDDDLIVDGYTMATGSQGGTGSASDAEYGGVIVMLQPTTPRT